MAALFRLLAIHDVPADDQVVDRCVDHLNIVGPQF